jgi:hypothetical protein
MIPNQKTGEVPLSSVTRAKPGWYTFNYAVYFPATKTYVWISHREYGFPANLLWPMTAYLSVSHRHSTRIVQRSSTARLVGNKQARRSWVSWLFHCLVPAAKWGTTLFLPEATCFLASDLRLSTLSYHLSTFRLRRPQRDEMRLHFRRLSA